MFTKIEKKILLEWIKCGELADMDALEQGIEIYGGKYPEKELKKIYVSIRRKIKSKATEIAVEDFEIFERMDGITTDLHKQITKLRRGPCNFKLKNSKTGSRSKRAN